MSNKQLRNVTRLVHIAIAALIGTLLYSLLRTDDTFILINQVVVFPALAITGIIMWQQPKVVKLLRRFQSE
jgi:hypothetical protein